MTAGERGFLLLGSHLGNPDRRCLSPAQFRELARRVRAADAQTELREMTLSDLTALGYSRSMAVQILGLLEQEALLDAYLRQASKEGLNVLTRLSGDYPQALRSRLGPDAPVCLWYRGDLSLLQTPCISLVGNRELRDDNAAFARQVGQQAALQGFTLVSGNARGADRTAQNACLEAGGQVISVLADELTAHRAKDNVLYLSEDSYDFPFSSLRALSRNRIIHALSPAVMVAQCDETRGGTWDGTQHNLRLGRSRVCCFPDTTAGIRALLQMGAEEIREEDLQDLSALCRREPNLFSY